MKNLDIKVYEYLRTIPSGKVVTYGQIAEHLGNKGLSRVVGTILHKNPDGIGIPCYKVVNNKGLLSEHYAFGGIEEQKARLERENIPVVDNRVNLTIYRYKDN